MKLLYIGREFQGDKIVNVFHDEKQNRFLWSGIVGIRIGYYYEVEKNGKDWQMSRRPQEVSKANLDEDVLTGFQIEDTLAEAQKAHDLKCKRIEKTYEFQSLVNKFSSVCYSLSDSELFVFSNVLCEAIRKKRVAKHKEEINKLLKIVKKRSIPRPTE